MKAFDEQWKSNEPLLRGLLISLVRNIDLADDLLQETYVRVCRKIDTYQGGDFRAWLAAVAKNTALSHLRKAHFKNETQMDSIAENRGSLSMGTDEHIDALMVRQALDSLSPVLREALILKHFGGFKYSEMAVKLQCPVGTAKRRVYSAISQLRETLGLYAEGNIMSKCSNFNLLDFAYGTLSEEDRETVEQHLKECSLCSEHLADIRRILSHLDQAEDQMVFVDINEMHKDGSSTTYGSFRMKMSSDKGTAGYSFESMNYHKGRAIYIDGEEVSFDVVDSGDGELNTYNVRLNRPYPPGETPVVLYVYDTPKGVGASIDIGFGRWVAVPDNSGSDTSDVLLVQMVKLPEKAKLIGSVPNADEVHANGHVTLIWKRLIKAGESRERPVVVYSIE